MADLLTRKQAIVVRFHYLALDSVGTLASPSGCKPLAPALYVRLVPLSL